MVAVQGANPGSMENVLSAACCDDTLPVPYEGSGQNGHDPWWDTKLQEDSFYTQAVAQEHRLPTNVTSVPTPVKSRHYLSLDILGDP